MKTITISATSIKYKNHPGYSKLLRIVNQTKRELLIKNPVKLEISSSPDLMSDFEAIPSSKTHILIANSDILNYTSLSSSAFKIVLLNEMKRFCQKEGILLSNLKIISTAIEKLKKDQVSLFPIGSNYNLQKKTLTYIINRVKQIKHKLKIKPPLILNILPHSYSNTIGCLYSQRMFNRQTVLTLTINLEFLQTNQRKLQNNPEFDAFIIHELTHLTTLDHRHNYDFKMAFRKNMQICNKEASHTFEKAYTNLSPSGAKQTRPHQFESPELKTFNIILHLNSGVYDLSDKSRVQISKYLKNYTGLKFIDIPQYKKVTIIKKIKSIHQKKRNKQISSTEETHKIDNLIYRVSIPYLSVKEKSRLKQSKKYLNYKSYKN